MALAVGYFDESTDEDTQGICYAVAGFVASNRTTAVLELRWRDLLTKYNLKYFKASELNAGEGQFRQYRDNPSATGYVPFSEKEKTKFAEIKTVFTDAIIQADGLNGIAAAVILPDYERIMQQYPVAQKTLSYPYYLCSNLVLVEAGLQVCIQNRSLSKSEKIYLRPVFDSHEDYSGRMKQGFDAFRERNPITSEYMLAPHYEDDQQYLTLQAADNFAFEIRKLAVGQHTNLRERIALTRLKDSGRIFRTYKLDYDNLKKIADAQSPDFNPLDPIDYTLEDIMVQAT